MAIYANGITKKFAPSTKSEEGAFACIRIGWKLTPQFKAIFVAINAYRAHTIHRSIVNKAIAVVFHLLDLTCSLKKAPEIGGEF